MGQGLRDVALAHAGWAVDPDVRVSLEEGARREIEGLGLVERGIEAEVEAFERLDGIAGGAPQAHPECTLRSALDLVVQERGEELDEGRRLSTACRLQTSRVSRMPDRRRVRSVGVR
jgi:hypothetical protein